MNLKVTLLLFCLFWFSKTLFSETYYTISINGANGGWITDKTLADFSLDYNPNPWIVTTPATVLLCQGRDLGYQKVKQDTCYYFDYLLNYYSKT
jgi:hypothetical protein